MNFMKSPYRSVMTDEYLENGLRRLFFFNKRFFSNNTGTGITVFDIITVLLLSLAISLVDKILSYLKVWPAEYCAYWYLARH